MWPFYLLQKTRESVWWMRVEVGERRNELSAVMERADNWVLDGYMAANKLSELDTYTKASGGLYVRGWRTVRRLHNN